MGSEVFIMNSISAMELERHIFEPEEIIKLHRMIPIITYVR